MSLLFIILNEETSNDFEKKQAYQKGRAYFLFCCHCFHIAYDVNIQWVQLFESWTICSEQIFFFSTISFSFYVLYKWIIFMPSTGIQFNDIFFSITRVNKHLFYHPNFEGVANKRFNKYTLHLNFVMRAMFNVRFFPLCFPFWFIITSVSWFDLHGESYLSSVEFLRNIFW